ncbi:MAG TPA: selenocysteine-specific translation elongation factor [Anaerolineales bacterium]|nr:selenocysteine-specific translation elongation factor [Anaerolineales bacterium]
MRVIGTAGHVDHGKSTLIAALTGTHPDRLKEEQAREMTIDLGFGWLTLPNGEEIGIVDVPGHRDFIENMLAGVGGIDAALLVVAVDEGVMPQTREHLAILDLLQVPAGIIVETKTDLISDREWLDAVDADIRAAVKGTVLQDAPIVRVSARSGSGLPQLLAALVEVLGAQPARRDLGRPRLPIDRVFTMSGFGTVVTGTLIDGHLGGGEEIEVLPSGLSGRVRGLQTHRKKEETAAPGSRTAVNISGIAAEAIQRGEVLARPGQYAPTRRLDAHFRLLGDISTPLLHNTEVKVFTGTSEVVATLRLLGAEELAPGAEGWIQLELREPLVAVRGDRYILRRPSPAETLGGGIIVDAQPKTRHKRFDSAVIESLASLKRGSPSEVLLEAAMALNAAPLKDVIVRSRLEPAAAAEASKELLESGMLIPLENGSGGAADARLVITKPHWQALRAKAEQSVSSYHGKYPLRGGMPREELKSRLGISPRLLNAVIDKLASEQEIVDHGEWVARAGHSIHLNRDQQAQVEVLMRKFAQQPYAPPTFKECQAELGDELANMLIEQGRLLPVSAEIVFRKEDYDEMVRRVRAALQEQGQITLAEVRDQFNTSRKYAQALLEHLDATGITRRDGDIRKLR